MTNLLVEPPARNVPKFRPYRGKPFTRTARRVISSGFAPEIQPSTSSGKLRTNSERAIYNLLVDNGYDPEIEPFALKIIRGGSANGRVGWFVPDLYVSLGDEDDEDSGWNGVYIEVSMAIDLGNKHHKMRFVAEKYGKMVILVTRDNIESFIADPDLLVSLISQARIEEFELEEKIAARIGKVDSDENHARLNSRMKPRYNHEKAAKPKKGKRRDPNKPSKTNSKPSRDPQRRVERQALRKKARTLQISVAEVKRLAAQEASFQKHWSTPERRIVSSSNIPSIVYCNPATKRIRSSAGPQRIGDRRRNTTALPVAA